MVFQQVRPQELPSGDSQTLMVIAFESEQLTSGYGIQFERGVDSFDAYRLAVIELTDCSQVWLLKYETDPNPGIPVRIDANADFTRAKAMVLQALELTEDDVIWTSPRVEE